MGHTVGELAKLARISVRALHHYDQIGLLTPTERTDAGYRLYGEDDLARLQQILFYRELGFPLAAIGKLLDDASIDRVSSLLDQRRMLLERSAHLNDMLALLDRTLQHLREGVPMSAEDRFQGFDPSQYDDEVRAQWGETPSYQESTRRTNTYRKEDWSTLRTELDEINAAYAALMERGIEAHDPRAMDVAERARLHIDRWFYPCSAVMHATIAAAYVSDPRFAAYYDQRRPGLARFVHDAVIANRDRLASAES
jgi:MerR family transcriptional regulator, thiopeptide resistance regulator